VNNRGSKVLWFTRETENTQIVSPVSNRVLVLYFLSFSLLSLSKNRLKERDSISS